MEFSTFEGLQYRLQKLYHNQQYTEAFDLATRMLDDFEDYSHVLAYWRIALSARLDKNEQATALLEEVLDSGFWYGETLLRKSSALQPLQGRPEFERLVERNLALKDQDPILNYPLLILRSEGRCLSGGLPCPLMIALHSSGSTARDSVEFWQPAASAGWLVGAPQSTQAMWKGAYVWNDRDKAEQEVQKRYHSLIEQYAVDRSKVILAGHAAGGETAIWLALNGSIQTAGFVVFGPSGPWMDDPEKWRPLVENNPNADLRGYIIAGEEDKTISIQNLKIISEQLNQAGIPCELEEVPFAGPDFTPEYESSLLRALAYVSGEF